MNIEAAVGCLFYVGTVEPFKSINQANQRLGNNPSGLVGITSDFDRAVKYFWSVDPAKIDWGLTPHLGTIVQAMDRHRVRIPDLASLRSSDYRAPVRRNISDILVEAASESYPGGEWSWLNQDPVNSVRTRSGSFILEAYGRVLEKDERTTATIFSDPEVTGKTVVLAIEEVLGLRMVDSHLARAVGVWYSEAEGFTKDFLDYRKAAKVLHLGFSVLGDNFVRRKGVVDVLSLASDQPRVFLQHVRDLDTATGLLNKEVQSEVDPSLVNIKIVQETVAREPLPTVLEGKKTGLHQLVKAYQQLNRLMEKGENINSAHDEESLTFHLGAKSAEAGLVGGMLHLTELWGRQHKSYRDLPFDVLVNAFCEVIGTGMRESRIFELLYRPEHGLNWYDPKWGFSEQFIDSLK